MARLQLSTDRQVAGLKPADRVYEIGVGGSRGFGVRILPTGLRQFEFRLARPGHAVAPRRTGPSSSVANTHVDEAKARALALCQKGDLHEAVLSICMGLSRHPDTASSHLAILGKAGLERAAAGCRGQVEDWIGGFR